MLLDQTMNIFEKVVQEIKEADQEKRNHFTSIAIDLLNVSTEALKTSPEFREAFAVVHAEFFKYPECRITISEAQAAFTKYQKPNN